MHCTICFIVLGFTAVCFDCTQLDARAFATDRVFIKRNRTATNDGNTNWTLTPWSTDLRCAVFFFTKRQRIQRSSVRRALRGETKD